MQALISIGSNLGESIEHCKRALRLLECKVVSASSLYRTSPVETFENQSPYFNVSAIVDTPESPQDFLKHLQGIEDLFGRTRPHYHAERTMDIDIVSIDGIVMNTEELVLPHPRSSMRLFVLIPTFEIAPRLAVELASLEAANFLRVLNLGETLVAEVGGETQEIMRITDPLL
ncbi:MAG: 2-amino-4-hydroxy-6-hydroxymethyldihydropteridine diphosphokinase [Actinomycetota bacterium]|nr:2-amino-4-hydroxy-6-hydroxymethyldihydropteridine diphosphokinase [Actinomycetota bacterium]